ncbi:MAG: hypothetical protein ABJL55_07065 [Roseibium sp.]
MPPITAAIKTPNAPTPPLSSAAGGFENVFELDEPEEEVLLDAELAAPVVDDPLPVPVVLLVSVVEGRVDVDDAPGDVVE